MVNKIICSIHDTDYIYFLGIHDVFAFSFSASQSLFVSRLIGNGRERGHEYGGCTREAKQTKREQKRDG